MVRTLALLAILVATPVHAQMRHAIQTAEARKVEVTITYRIECNRFSAERWMVYVPRPPELPGQVRVKASTTPTSKLTAEKSPLARPMFLFDQKATPATTKRFDMDLKLEATLLSRKLVPLAANAPAPRVTPLKESERKYYTAPSSLIDFENSLFRDWLAEHKLKRQPREHELAFATRVLERIREQYEYGFDSKQDQRASLACGRTKADCGGMAFVFVGALRASGIPARPLLGRIAKPRRDGSKPTDLDYDHPHVRVEFFAPDLGWVPVDPSAVQGNRSRPVAEFLGDDAGDLIVLHVDVDLMLPFRDRTERAPFLQIGPYYHVYGTGPFDATFGETGWKLTVK